MITSADVAQVAFTGDPLLLANYTLTIDAVMRLTAATDWDDWITLDNSAATRVAEQINAARPWKRNVGPAAISARSAMADTALAFPHLGPKVVPARSSRPGPARSEAPGA